MTEIGEGIAEEIRAVRRRRRAYEEGVHELAEDEGFNCSECEFHELTIPMESISLTGPASCPNCGSTVETSGEARKYLKQFM